MAFQGGLLEFCPVHLERLTSFCPSCSRPMLWKSAASYSRSAFRCVKGCDYLRGAVDGLFNDNSSVLDTSVSRFRAFRSLVRSAVQLSDGVMLIRFPTAEPADTYPAGLIPALLRKLSDQVSDPSIRPFEEPSAAERQSWRIAIEELTPKKDEGNQTKSELPSRYDTFTFFPVANLADLAALLSPRIRWPKSHEGRLSSVSGLIKVPSTWLINEEFQSISVLRTKGSGPSDVREATYIHRLALVLNRGAARQKVIEGEGDDVSTEAEIELAYECYGLATTRGRRLRFHAKRSCNRTVVDCVERWKGSHELAPHYSPYNLDDGILLSN